MPKSTAVAMRLQAVIEDAFTVFIKHHPDDTTPENFVARALDDAGVAEAVEALEVALRDMHHQSWPAKQVAKALAALTGSKETSDE